MFYSLFALLETIDQGADVSVTFHICIGVHSSHERGISNSIRRLLEDFEY